MTNDWKMTEANSTYRRRRRRSRKARHSPFRHRSTGKIIAGVVSVLAVVDVVGTVAALHASTVAYGLVGPGMSRDDVRYAMGEPASRTQTQAGGIDWLYRQGSGRFRVRFDSRGIFSRATCGSESADVSDCPEVLGLHLGTGEEQVWDALGAPERQGYAGDTKVIEYPSLGLGFGLRRLQVVQISLSADAGNAYLARLPRVLLP